MQLWLDRLASPVGELRLVVDEQGALRALEFDDHDERLHRLLKRHYGRYELIPSGARGHSAGPGGLLRGRCLPACGTNGRYRRHAVPAPGVAGAARDPGGQHDQLWRAGEADRAARACRAVGLANGANPVAIVVPCHRVIGANGTLTGYGGGLPRKQWLVAHERRLNVPAVPA